VTQIRRWREQRWLLDSVIEQRGLDYDQLRWANTIGATGPDAAGDYDLIQRAVTRFDEIGPAFAERADRRLRKARDSEEAGDEVSAREHFFVAAAFLGWAQWPLHDDGDPRMRQWNDLKLEAFSGYAKHSDRVVRRVQVSYGDTRLAGWLHLPFDGDPPYPVMLVVPGMDTFKELLIAMYGDKFLQRGFATLAIDCPGQSEALANRIKLTPTSFADAAGAWLEWIAGQDDLDADRVGAYGRSFGSFATAQIAAHHSDRLKGAAGALVVHEPGLSALLNEAAPSFRIRMAYMLGVADDEELDALAAQFDLRAVASRISCPYLAVAGEIDQLSPTQHTIELAREMSGPREVLVYEGDRHAMGRSMAARNGPNWHSYTAEWMRKVVIEGTTPPSGGRKLFVRSDGGIDVTELTDNWPGAKEN
jgi:dienelactone hydrolase